MQTDPIGYKDDMDLYAYVGNDPVNREDPTGNCGTKGNGKNSEGGGSGCPARSTRKAVVHQQNGQTQTHDITPQSNPPTVPILHQVTISAPPEPAAIPPVITPGTFAIEPYVNALEQALAEIDAQTLAKLAIMAHLAGAGERHEPKPPNPEAPPPQTTEQPLNQSEWYYDPQTGTVYNPTTQEAFNPTTGEPVPMPEDVFVDF